MQGGGVTQQHLSPVFLRLAEEGVQQPADADEAQSLATARRQREVPLSDPAEGHPRAVRGDTRERIRPHPQHKVWFCNKRFWCFGSGIIRWLKGSSALLRALLPAFRFTFEVVSVGGLLGAGAGVPFAQQLQVFWSWRAHHGVELGFAFGQQGQAHPRHAHSVWGQKRVSRRLLERGRPPAAAWPLTSRCGQSAPSRQKPQRLPAPEKRSITFYRMQFYDKQGDAVLMPSGTQKLYWSFTLHLKTEAANWPISQSYWHYSKL